MRDMLKRRIMTNMQAVRKPLSADLKSIREKSARRAFVESSNAMNATSTLTRPTVVWLIEDNHSFRHTLVKVLKEVHDLDCARHFGNSEEALEELSRCVAPDVILVDVELPGLNGLEAVKQIRSI